MMQRNKIFDGLPKERIRISDSIIFLTSILATLLIFSQNWDISFTNQVDLPNHRARHAIQCGTDAGLRLSEIYEFRLRLLPNIIGDLLFTSEFLCKDIVKFTNIIGILSTVNLFIATYFLYYVVWNRISLWPCATSLLFYNINYMNGFENFYISVPFVIYAIGIVTIADRRLWKYRNLLILVLSCILYTMHVIAFGMFLVVVFATGVFDLFVKERSQDLTRRVFALARRAAATGLPLVHFIYLNIAAPPSHGSGTSINLYSRGDVLFSPFAPGSYGGLPVGELALHSATILALLAMVLVGWRTGVLESKPRNLFALAVLGFFGAIAPEVLSGVWGAHIRIPLVWSALLIASLNWRISITREVPIFAIVAALFLVRTEVVKHNWSRHDAEVREYLAAFETVAGEPVILTAFADDARDLGGHLHTEAYLGLVQGRPVYSLFYGANPLSPRPEYRALTLPQRYPARLGELSAEYEAYLKGATTAPEEYWSGWPGRYDHLLVLGRGPLDTGSLPAEVVLRGSFFTLLKITGAVSGK